jgi:hypothetical protein
MSSLECCRHASPNSENTLRMNYSQILILVLLTSVPITAQEVATAPIQPVFSVLSESTVQNRDGSSITFRQVAPPVVTPLPQPAPPAAAPMLTAAEEAAFSQMPVREFQVLSISASVDANGFTVLRWTCGESQRLQAVSNVDFHYLEGLGSLETPQASYMLILSAGSDEQAMTEAEVHAAQSLPVNGSASFALVSGSTAASPADEAALDAMNSLLDYFDTHRADLVKLQAQREAERAARELAASTAPPPPPRHSIVHFWPLQPAQRAAILENTQREKAAKQP